MSLNALARGVSVTAQDDINPAAIRYPKWILRPLLLMGLATSAICGGEVLVIRPDLLSESAQEF